MRRAAETGQSQRGDGEKQRTSKERRKTETHAQQESERRRWRREGAEEQGCKERADKQIAGQSGQEGQSFQGARLGSGGLSSSCRVQTLCLKTNQTEASIIFET